MYIFDITSRIDDKILQASTAKFDRASQSEKYTNEVIENLAGTVVNSGLTISLEEARTLLVPSFLYWGLLPPPPGAARGSNTL